MRSRARSGPARQTSFAKEYSLRQWPNACVRCDPLPVPRDAAPRRPMSEQNNVENRDWFHDGNFSGQRALVRMTLRPWLRGAAALEHSSYGTTIPATELK